MKPVACGNQVYSTGSLSSPATMSAILFSKPSPLSFENGRLAGSAQTRKAVRSTRSTRCACAPATNATKLALTATGSSTAVSLAVTETLLLVLIRCLGLVGVFGRAPARQTALSTRFQIDVDVLDKATHIGVVAECRHLGLLVGANLLFASRNNEHEFGVVHHLQRLDQARRIGRALTIRPVTHVALGMIAAETRERVPIDRAVAGGVVGWVPVRR